MIILLFASLLSAPPSPAPKETAVAEISLEDLPDATDFTLSLDGETQQSFLSESECVYWEWVYGVVRNGNWVVTSRGYQSNLTIQATTKQGTFELTTPRMRTFLKPSWEKVFDKKHKAEAPEAVRPMIDDEDSPITVVEYCLKKNTGYHARIKSESGLLPPSKPNGPPRERKHVVLVVSDRPFKDGRPQGEVTPAYRGWKY
jgi:hypothetical protein